MVLRTAILAAAMFVPHRLFARLYRVPPYKQLLQDWVSGLDLVEGSTLAEAGCGPGLLSVDLARSGYRVTGVDWSSRMIEAASHLSDSRLQFIRGDALALPLAPSSLDACVAASLINVVPDPVRLVRELARVTRPGGRVSCLFPGPAMVSAVHKLPGLSYIDRALLDTWATASRKLEPHAVATLMAGCGLQQVFVRSFWEGSVHAVTGLVGTG